MDYDAYVDALRGAVADILDDFDNADQANTDDTEDGPES